MYRISLGFGSIVLVAGLVVAIVQAQEAAQPKPLIGVAAGQATNSSRRAAAGIGAAVRADEAAPGSFPAAGTRSSTDRADSSPGLRSVLRGPVGKSNNAAPRLEPMPMPSASTTPPAAAVEQPTLQAPELEPAPLSAGTPADPPPTRSVTPLTSAAEPRSFTARRYGEDTAPQALPNRISSKPVTSRRIGGSTGVATRPGEAVVSCTGPLVRVDTKGPPAISVGEEATYVVTLANLGEVEAKELTIRVAIPEGVQLASTEATFGSVAPRQEADGLPRVVWQVERLASRAEHQFTLKVVATANRPFELAVDWAMSPIAGATQIEVQQPQLQVALNGPAEIVYGETKIFSVELTNPGTGDAKGVTVELVLGTGTADTLKVGVLPAGERKTFDVEVTAREGTNMQITANATGDNKLQAQASHALAVLRANLEVIAAGPTQQFSGSVATYQVKVVNTGNAVAKSVQAAARLPRGVKYVKGLENAKQLPDALVWSAGDLLPNAERVYQFQCQLTTDGDQVVGFGARTSGGIESAGEVVTKVESVADLKLVVNDPKGPIPVGDEATYEVLITNRGTKAATQVAVVAQFSEGVEPVSTEGSQAERMPGQVIFRPVAQIAPNETVTLRIKAKASQGGNHVFRAEVKCPEPETKLVAEQTTRYYGGGALVNQNRPAPGIAPTTAPPPAESRPETPQIGARRPGTLQR